MKFLALATILAAACSRAVTYAPFHSPLGFSTEVPAGWRLDADPVPDRKPATTSFFIGIPEPLAEGRPMGAVLSFGRFVRRSSDVPGAAAARKSYEDGFLKPTRKLFGDDAKTSATRRYSRTLNLTADGAPLTVRVEGAALRTPDDYFLIECRSTSQHAELCREALERALKTFVPPPAASKKN